MRTSVARPFSNAQRFERAMQALTHISGRNNAILTCVHSGCRCATLLHREQSYNSQWGDGFVATYDTSALGCSSADDCNGHECGIGGLCHCAPGAYGADCSLREHCVGTSTSDATIGEFSSSIDALERSALYPNGAECHFVNSPPPGYAFVRYRITFDL